MALTALAAQDGANASQQFPRLEWLGQIIVRPQFQTNDAVHGIALGGQHQYRHLRRSAWHGAYAAADLKPIHVRQHQIQNHQIGQLQSPTLTGLQLLQTGFPIGHMGHFQAVIAQIVAHHLGQSDVVLNHQKLVRAHRGQCSHARASIFLQDTMLQHANDPSLSGA